MSNATFILNLIVLKNSIKNVAMLSVNESKHFHTRRYLIRIQEKRGCLLLRRHRYSAHVTWGDNAKGEHALWRWGVSPSSTENSSLLTNCQVIVFTDPNLETEFQRKLGILTFLIILSFFILIQILSNKNDFLR